MLQQKAADDSDKDIEKWHCHGGIPFSTKQNHISSYFSVDPEFNRPRTNIF